VKKDFQRMGNTKSEVGFVATPQMTAPDVLFTLRRVP